MFILAGLLIIVIGIFSITSKKPAGFYTFTKPKIDDSNIKEYNKKTGILFICFGIVVALFELPFYFCSEDFFGIIVILLMPILVISIICIYEFKILRKYR